jgi:hypothetical protein
MKDIQQDSGILHEIQTRHLMNVSSELYSNAIPLGPLLLTGSYAE